MDDRWDEVPCEATAVGQIASFRNERPADPRLLPGTVKMKWHGKTKTHVRALQANESLE